MWALLLEPSFTREAPKAGVSSWEAQPTPAPGSPGWSGSLSHTTGWSVAAPAEVPPQCLLLAETCSADTAVVWAGTSFQDRVKAIIWAQLGWEQTTQPSSKSVGAEMGGKSHRELLCHPCRFLHRLRWSQSRGRSWHPRGQQGSRLRT